MGEMPTPQLTTEAAVEAVQQGRWALGRTAVSMIQGPVAVEEMVGVRRVRRWYY